MEQEDAYRKSLEANCAALLELASSEGWNLDGEKLEVKVYSKYKTDDPVVCLKVTFPINSRTDFTLLAPCRLVSRHKISYNLQNRQH